jgi:hypothetical protein
MTPRWLRLVSGSPAPKETWSEHQVVSEIVSAPTVWVHTESQGDRWRVLGVYSSPDSVLPTQPAWEHQGGQAFARIRDDGWSEWLEPTEYHHSQQRVEGAAESNGVAPPVIRPGRSPWARPG